MSKRNSGKSKTLMELVLEKYPDFDPKTCSVFLNNQPVEEDELKRSSIPFDIVRILKIERGKK